MLRYAPTSVVRWGSCFTSMTEDIALVAGRSRATRPALCGRATMHLTTTKQARHVQPPKGWTDKPHNERGNQ